MLASHRYANRRRRGIVLVLILAMLGLLAVIGVTFATLSGQTQVGARYYVKSAEAIDPDRFLDFGLDQLINDTSNPISALRGHSLLRDMYGDDAWNHGSFTALPGGLPIVVTNVAQTAGGGAADWTIQTNIPYDSYTYPELYNKRFADDPTTSPAVEVPVQQSWFLRLEVWVHDPSGFPYAQFPALAGQTFQVVGDFLNNGAHALVLSTSDSRTPGLVQPNELLLNRLPASPPGYPNGSTFVLHARLDNTYRAAFNGPGMAALGAFANFRLNGPIQGTGSPVGNPAPIGMDEDYDAVDLDNWFLCMESADGSVLIPSFHRPGILRYEAGQLDDWTDLDNLNTSDPNRFWKTRSRILRPRAADGHDDKTFAPLRPRLDGKIGRDEDGDGVGDPGTGYDVDNDGDGTYDSVWLDLGYPVQTDPKTGKNFKPLFAFKVLPLNGKLPLNTAGNLQGRVQHDDNVTDTNYPIGRATYDHTSHYGTSPSEINPRFALQAPIAAGAGQGQFDNANVEVSLTQLRNLLAGTRPQVLDSLGNVTSEDANFVVNANFANRIYLPNNLLDNQDVDLDGDGTGARRGVPPVAGRWGEPDGVPAATALFYNSFVGPGRSIYIDPSQRGIINRVSAHDDDYAGLDFSPWDPNATPPQYPEMANFLDPAGALQLPAERRRYFVQPFDIAGTGRVISFNGMYGRTATAPGVPDNDNPFDNEENNGNRVNDPFFAGHGPDRFGRVAFLHYFRPPGFLPNVENVGDQRAIVRDAMGNITGTFSHNLYHGHESHRVPDGRFGAITGAAPYQWSDAVADANGNLPPPATTTTTNPQNVKSTFDTNAILTQPITYYNTASSGFRVYPVPAMPPLPPPYQPNGLVYNGENPNPAGGLALNDSAETELYGEPANDQPFSPSDLEWLYRHGSSDTDAKALDSRLAKLAPAALANPVDGANRSRFFTTETWDLNNIALGASPLIGTSYFNHAVNVTNTRAVQWDTSGGPNSGNATAWVPINQVGPSVANRDRRINLNFPLPSSNDPHEPVRQKWIRETYELLKRTVPPASIDTPAELAALSQFVVNIIDFRDPDAASTRFVNTDIIVTAPTATSQATLALRDPTSQAIQDDAGNTDYFPFDVRFRNGTTRATVAPFPAGQHSYLEQFGTEYSPVAINEILAFSYKRGTAQPGTDTPRFFIELVNTLTRDGNNDQGTLGGGTSAHLNLGDADQSYASPPEPRNFTLKALRYDMVIAQDTAARRPDPYTGQVPVAAAADAVPANARWNIQYEAAATRRYSEAMTVNGAPTGLDNYYYVFSNTAPDPNAERNPPAPPGLSRNVPDTFFPQMGTGAAVIPDRNTPDFYWIYLRRPANPDRPIQEDPARADFNPAVVVDSFRFPYTESGADGGPQDMSGRYTVVPATPTRHLYSLQRLQPYRGAQIVPGLGAGAPPIDFRYGFSEQTRPPRDDSNYNAAGGAGFTGMYGNTNDVNSLIASNREAVHTLGRPSDTRDTTWDRFPFHDRDFHSLAELTLVPGCPPGLLTKRFVENPADTDNDPNTAPYTETESPPPMSPTFNYEDKNFNGQLDPGEDDNMDGNLDHDPVQFYDFDPARLADIATPPLTKPALDPTYSAGPPARIRSVVGQPFEQPDPNLTPTPRLIQLPRVFPYLVDKFYYNHVSLNPPLPFPQPPDPRYPLPAVAGQDDGWHSIFELFEVPNPYVGAIGEVAYGNNGDWLRRDNRPGQLNLNMIIDEEVFFGLLDDPRLSLAPAGAPPQIVSLINNAGTVAASYAMNSRGFAVLPPFTNPTTFGNNPTMFGNIASGTMKAAFADFLRLRHGGNDLFFGGANERPFRSLSNPDIRNTVLRPAVDPTVIPGAANRNLADNMRYGATAAGALLPQTPLRRLFQIADVDNRSNAALAPLGVTTPHPILSDPNANLTSTQAAPASLQNPANPLLGGNIPLPNGAGPAPAVADLRQHPAFRTEWLQKILNLTTVRSHQYAVWVTVGYFEVKRVGNPQLATDPVNFNAAIDKLGKELPNTRRTRAFFVLDRTRATGFSPADPENFRKLIVHRRRIQ